jgi:regulatory protein
MLAMELRQKGVADDTIQAALADGEDDATLAFQAATRYAHRLDDLEWQKFREKLGSFLLRRGFSYDIIRTVVQQVWDEMHPAGFDPKLSGNEEI